jgi:hypothetical protein
MRPSITRLFTAAAASAFLFTSSTLFPADAVRPTVECLPDDTVVMVHVPNGQKFIDEFRAQTKLGRVLLSKERIDAAFAKLKEKKPEDYAKAEKDLGNYGLKIDDLKDLFTGDSGFAVSMRAPAKGDKKPQGSMFFWVEPQGELGKKLYAALQKGIEQEQGENKPTRTDIKIEGVDVMKVTKPRFKDEAVPMEVPANFDKMTDEERNKWIADQTAKRQNPKKVRVGEDTMFFALLGNRIVAMSAIPDESGDKAPAADQDQAVFGGFLKSHLASGKAAGFVDKMNKTAGMQAAMPAGVVAFDAFVDPGIIVKIAAAQEAQGDQDPKKIIEALGLDNIGPVGFRSVVAGSLVKTGFFLSTPGPRKGLLTLLDQKELAPEPAAWAASSLASYIHWSFDLAKAYKLAKEVAVQIKGPEAEQNFQMAEAQSQAMLKADVSKVLASLGVQHSIGLYVPEVHAKPEAKPKAEGADEEAEAPAQPQQPLCVVWNLTDQAIWTQIIQAIAPFAAQPGGPILPANEQGFTGFRSAPGAPTEGALLTGKNILLFAMGPKVAEQTLNAVNTPPVGEASLKQGKAFAHASTLIKLRPGILFAIAGNEKAGEQFVENVLNGFDAALRNNPKVSKADSEVLRELIQSLLPKPEELKGAYGVGVSQGYNTPNGMIIESVSEFPKN